MDGKLDEPAWQKVPRGPRFRDLVSNEPRVHDTRAAVMWDDEYLYVGYWVEEPFVRGTLTRRDSHIYTNNDVELFIAGKDTYYEFEINSLGTIYEVFFIWQEAYDKVPYAEDPALTKQHLRGFNGVGFNNHPRGPRWGSWAWDFPGLKTAVWVDGTCNNDNDRDRGWTVELAYPWKGMKWLAAADKRALPPNEADVWRIDFTRFNQYKEAPPVKDNGGWAWSYHGAWDSHMPEVFPFIHFTKKELSEVKPAEKKE